MRIHLFPCDSCSGKVKMELLLEIDIESNHLVVGIQRLLSLPKRLIIECGRTKEGHKSTI